MPSDPLVVRRDGAEFSLRRLDDNELHRRTRRATCVADDSMFWLQWHCRRFQPDHLSLPVFLVAMTRRFGPSGCAFDDYKSSFCFPFHLTTQKAGVHGDYLLLVEDRKGGLHAPLLRHDGHGRAASRAMPDFVAAEFSRDDYRYVMHFLEGYLEGQEAALARFPSKVPDFVQRVDAALLLYGYRAAVPFERHFEDEGSYAAALSRVPNALLDRGTELEFEFAV